MEIVWGKEPPPRGVYAEVAAEIMERPGEWALVVEGSQRRARTMCDKIKRTGTPSGAFWPPGLWEVRLVWRRGDLWIKYIEPRDTPQFLPGRRGRKGGPNIATGAVPD